MGGSAPTLVLVHGLGATGAVWDRLLELGRWPGRVLVPDLRGHGGSPWAANYSLGSMAADVAGLLGPGETSIVVGHSLGGVVAMALATGWYGVTVQRCLTIGIKVAWSPAEVDRIPELAARPRRHFSSRPEAAAWFLKLAGLHGIVDSDDPMTERGVIEVPDGWTTTQDPRTIVVGPPPMASLHAAVEVPVRHVCGADDPLVTWAELVAYDADAVQIDGAGHNAMVERPADVLELIER